MSSEMREKLTEALNDAQRAGAYMALARLEAEVRLMRACMVDASYKTALDDVITRIHELIGGESDEQH